MSRLLLSSLQAAGLLAALPASAASGCLLYADGNGQTLSSEGDCSSQLPPASTFKAKEEVLAALPEKLKTL